MKPTTLAKIGTEWRVQNVLNSFNCVLDVGELGHCNFCRDQWGQTESSCCEFSTANEHSTAFVPSVTIPKVPSAPINNLVVSNPAEDLRALCRVLITSPDGSTTVTFKNHSAFAVPLMM